MSTPAAARIIGDRLRRAGDARARTTWPAPAWRGRIVEFCLDVLGKRTLARHQVEALEQWQRDGRVELAMCTGQKLGKTEVLEDAAAYDFATTQRLNGFIFGPKLEHTNEVFWPRFSQTMLAAYLPCRECMPAHRAWEKLVEENPFDETPRPERCLKCSSLIPSTQRDPKDKTLGRVSEWLDPVRSETGLRAPDGRALRGYAGRKEGAKGGFSGAVRFYCDESSDVGDVDRETIRGNMSGGGKAIFAGNLLYQWGWFYRAFTTEREAYTHVLQMSSRLSPNCTGRIEWSDGQVTTNASGDRPIPGMATREDIEANLRAWKGTNLISARVDATPPKIVEGQLAPEDRVKAAEERLRSHDDASGMLQLGVDVARKRDRFSVCVRRGITMIELYAEALNQDDHVLGVSLALDFAAKYRKPHERKPRLVYDASGLEGASFAKELHAWRHPEHPEQTAQDHVDIYAVQMSHPPRNRKLFDKRRDEIAHAFAEKLKTIAILPDAELEGEIAATIGETVEVSYGESRMKWRVLRVIDNDDLRKRIGRSPDKRNAAELAFLDVDGTEGASAAPVEAKPAGAASEGPAAPSAAQARQKPRTEPEDDIQAVGSVFDRQASVYRDLWGTR